MESCRIQGVREGGKEGDGRRRGGGGEVGGWGEGWEKGRWGGDGEETFSHRNLA